MRLGVFGCTIEQLCISAAQIWPDNGPLLWQQSGMDGSDMAGRT